MNVLIDTSIWSLALRRRKVPLDLQQRRLVDEWRRLIEKDQAVVVGPVRQEILSGIASSDQFEQIRKRISGFDCPDAVVDDFDQAAIFYNHLCRVGVAGGAIDLLICGMAYRRGLSIFTNDRDFERYAAHLPIHLHQVDNF
jgi:predicted nucleic acid-binding protein